MRHSQFTSLVPAVLEEECKEEERAGLRGKPGNDGISLAGENNVFYVDDAALSTLVSIVHACLMGAINGWIRD